MASRLEPPKAQNLRGSLARLACLAVALAFSAATVHSATAGTLVAWGDNSNGQISPLPTATDIIAISAGGGHSVGVRANGTVVVWGLATFGQLDVPPGLTGVIAASAGFDHCVALRNDGRVVSWGRNQAGQTNVPVGLANVVAVSANGYHSLALLSDGTVVPWGDPSFGMGTVPPGLGNVVAISAGPFHNLALRSNGTVVGWGQNDSGESTTPAGLSGVVEIVAGGEHNLARKSDGTVVAWGKNNFGQTDLATGLTGIVGIAAGWAHSMVLKADGTVVARGWNDFGQTNVPAGLAGVSAISGGYQHSVALLGGAADPPPIIHCPADVRMTCADCNIETNRTGTATATDNGTVRITYSDAVSGDCPKTVVRTWTATDNAGQTATCVQTITCRMEDSGLTVTCPPDVLRTCADCNLDPSETGTAAATGGTGTVRVTHTDSSSGECPKVVNRTWTATDDAGQTASCVQRLTCMLVNAVTDSSLCLFDRDNDTAGQQFRLLFIQDPQNFPCFRLVASNPGQFAYNVIQTGTPGQELTFNVTLPYPFVTHGANPIHAYDGVTVHSNDGQACLRPGEGFFASSQQVTLEDYAAHQSDAITVPVTVRVPDSGMVFLSLHLEYGLRHTTGYTRNSRGDALDCDSLRKLILNGGTYLFSVDGAQTANTSASNVNDFKKVPGVCGLVLEGSTEDPVPGTEVKLINPRGTVIGSRVTDEDGFYLIAFKHSGKAAVYTVSIQTPDGHQETKPVTLKANRLMTVDFDVP